MPYYTSLGDIPPKRHIQFRRPDGELYSEEVFGTEGFVGPTSTMYHIHPPTQVSGWKTLYSTKTEFVETDVMRMRHLKTAEMEPNGDPITGRVVLFNVVRKNRYVITLKDFQARSACKKGIAAFSART